MAKVFYSDAMIDEFIETAKEMGIGPAIRMIKYPTYATALKWFDMRGVPRPDVDSLIQKAAELKQFYGDKEKKFAAQAAMDRIVASLLNDDLDADAINKLTNALNKLIQTMNLIEGKATTVHEQRQKDGTDLAVMDMLNAAKAKNALHEQTLSEPS